jgi:hypothetical protein
MLAALAIAAMVGGGLWWSDRLAHRAVPPARLPSGPAEIGPPPGEEIDARKHVGDLLGQAPAYTPFFDALVAKFPADAANLREAFAERVVTDRASANPDRFLADALKALRQTRGVVAAKADDAALGRVFSAQSTMLAALREADPKLCVDFLYGGATDAFLDFVAPRRPLFAELAQANLAAILDGAEKKIEREAPNDDDFNALEQALRAAGLGDVEIAALLDGKAPDPPLPDERMCDAGRAYLKAIQALPEPARSRLQALAVEVMSRS